MLAQNVAFWIVAVVMAGAAIGVVRTKNVVHAALFLVVVLAGAAAQYILIAAEFVAWVQVLIYIGAVVILFLFGIMLTRAPMRPEDNLDNDQRWPAAIVAAGLLAVLIVLLVDAFGEKEIELTDDLLQVGRTDTVGNSIFRQFVVPFEVVSMLLLAALVGAVAIARRD
ncbi:MAG TPA: NADH-quinone oxidoreductase subunit J [Acidimicrobiia bacterium]|nr:NADH-quinone oxidoreductase subunit J [Acidimicrobiia bacterium]